MLRSFPQGLKPADLGALIGTDKSVPFQNLLPSLQIVLGVGCFGEGWVHFPVPKCLGLGAPGGFLMNGRVRVFWVSGGIECPPTHRDEAAMN